MTKKADYLHIRIDTELKDKLKERAEADGRTISNYIEMLIKRDLDKGK